MHAHDGDIAPEIKRALLEQEIALWKNTRYQAEIRLRVHRRLQSGAEAEAALIADMERCETALDCLNDELAALAT